MERMAAGPPAVKVADNRDLTGVRRPDGKADAGRPVSLGEVGPELFVDAEVAPLGPQVDVEIS